MLVRVTITKCATTVVIQKDEKWCRGIHKDISVANFTKKMVSMGLNVQVSYNQSHHSALLTLSNNKRSYLSFMKICT